MSAKQQQIAEAPKEAGQGEASEAALGVEALVVEQIRESPAGNNLLEEILSRGNLLQALQRVKSNRGAPGVDGMTVEELPGYLKEHWPRIRQEILNGKYIPAPVRRVEIPKPAGGVRKLGIPTVLDRLIQQAILQVLQPEWDQTFSPHSLGFRPGRSAHQAIRQAQQYVRRGYVWVVDLDLEKFFDQVNHDRLMARLWTRTKDKRVLKLIRAYLRAGVLEGGLVSPTEEGTPQGGPLSPLLSNIVLDELDRELEKRGHRFVRYADDANVYVRSEKAGHRVMESVTRFITKRLKLKVNAAKSAVGKPQKRKFLGFSLSKSNRIMLSPEAVKRLKQKIRQLTSRTAGRSLKQVIAQLKRYLTGWFQYFGIAQLKRDFDELDSWIRHRLRSIVWKQWRTGKTRYRELVRRGVKPFTAWVTIKSGHGPWRLSRSPAVQQVLPAKLFATLGLPSLIDLLSSRRTAV